MRNINDVPAHQLKSILIGMSIATVILFAVGLAFYIRDVRRSLASEQWPSTRGQVLSAELESGTSGGVGSEIKYRYVVGGKAHLGKNIVFGRPPPWNDDYEIVAAYWEGLDVAVYYDPSDPSVSVLRPGWHAGNVITPIIGIIVLLGVLIGNYAIAKRLGISYGRSDMDRPAKSVSRPS